MISWTLSCPIATFLAHYYTCIACSALPSPVQLVGASRYAAPHSFVLLPASCIIFTGWC
ncbi:hypothetical protein EXIGLDRAFT_729885 [Exidia glandulosa HHB12029]|uniref:Uncharacterized protein n=1 Tax=Exidia glandulosa HHB12029 TaxID=1314781 RepID=A0A165LFZ6_EXIGL|nr:hypothetical protein EXIGLDRAFT_729885 [Exidia glandulosa HHB12029]